MSKALPMVRDEFFIAFGDEWKFLVDYFSQYKTTPNRATLIEQFPDFPWEPSENALEWVVDEVSQEMVGRKLARAVEEVRDAAELNPREAVRMLITQSQDLSQYLSESVGERIDLRMTSEARVNELRTIKKRSGLTGISHGFELFDKITHGTQHNEIELWFGRPGEKKTYLLLYGAYQAWKAQDAVVSFISPEMSEQEIGLRLDAIAFNISQGQIIGGAMEDDEWTRYFEEIAIWMQGDHPGFFFRDAGGLGRNFSTGDLASVVRTDKPDLVCVDGLLFIEPMRREFKDTRTRLVYATRELKELVMTSKIPIRLTHQANRQSEISTTRRSKTLTLNDLLPDLQHLAEADATGQFANRAFSVKEIKGRTYICIRKNRNGPENIIISCKFDADRGIVDEIVVEDIEARPGEMNEQPFDDPVPF